MVGLVFGGIFFDPGLTEVTHTSVASLLIYLTSRGGTTRKRLPLEEAGRTTRDSILQHKDNGITGCSLYRKTPC